MDLISREDALKWCKPEEWGTPDERWRPESEYGAFIQALPSAEKTGRWIEQDDEYNDTIYQCSVCGEEFVTIEGTPADNLWNYCPNCGARMEG